MDLFVVPTIGFDLLYAFIIIRLDRRDLVWINVTQNPTAEWIARQLTEAFPWHEAPRYLIRDRDRIYGEVARQRIRAMGIRDKPIAPASPWQNGFAERLIGSIRRECVDHTVVLGEAHLRRILQTYAGYYNKIRTHRSLDKDAPAFRPVQRSGTSRHTRFSVGFITITYGFRFSVQTADHFLPTALRTADHGARPATNPVAWRHSAPNGGMDRQPTDGGLWLGATPSLSDPRSGCLLRRHIRPTRSLAWH